MQRKALLLALFGAANLYALSLNGNAELKSPLSVEFGLEGEVSKGLVGTLSDKKLLTCQPALEGTVKFKGESLLLFTKDMRAGTEYSCKLENGSTASFRTKEFELQKIEKLTDNKYILKFNDDVKASAVKQIGVLGDNSKNIAFDITLPEPKVVPDITKDELRQIVERMLAPVPEFYLETFYVRVKSACKSAYFAEFLRLNFADTFSFKLFERQKIDGMVRELSAHEIVEILWGERG